jgi:hypothetical protein
MVAIESRPQNRRHDPEARQVSGRDHELQIDKPDIGMVKNEIDVVVDKSVYPPSVLPEHRHGRFFHA